jgi:hypothetical protein
MSKKVNIIVTQPPYGKEDAFSAIPMGASQVAAGNEASMIFVSGSVHSIVKGQKTGYGDHAAWYRDVSSVELEITADDPVAPQNIDAWSKKSGNKLLSARQEGNIFIILVQRTYALPVDSPITTPVAIRCARRSGSGMLP